MADNAPSPPTAAPNPAPHRSTSDTSSSPSDSASPPPPIFRRTTTDQSLRTCFICYSTSADDPSAPFVHACTCSLDAHESCMLKWITESKDKSASSLQCPACKSKISVVQPRDRLLGVVDVFRKVGRVLSPGVLVSITGTCTVVASATYGAWAMMAFVGGPQTMRWMRVEEVTSMYGRQVPVGLQVHRRVQVANKLVLLGSILPGLLLWRALPFYTTRKIFMPLSMAYSIHLVSSGAPLPTWPPSPAWTLVATPYVHYVYNLVWTYLLGDLEKRLNKALLNADTAQADNAPAVAAAPAPDLAPAPAPAARVQAAPNAAPANAGRNDDVVARVGNAVRNVLGGRQDENGAIDAQIQIPIGPGDDPQAVIQEVRNGLRADGIDAADDLEIIVEDVQPVANPDIPIAPAPVPVPVPAAARPVQEVVGDDNAGGRLRLEFDLVVHDHNHHHDHHHHHDHDIPPANPNDVEPAPAAGIPLLSLSSRIASTLLFPLFATLTGEILRISLPTSWTFLPNYSIRGDGRPPGLMQQRWGRSVVGACVYVVVRDVFGLWVRKRRVEQRKGWRVKDVPRVEGSRTGARSGDGGLAS